MAGNINWHEINRKIFHIIGGLVLAFIIYYNMASIWTIIFITMIGIILSIIYTTYDVPLINYFLNKFEREHLKKKYPGRGVIHLFLALILMMMVFERNTILAGIMIWTFGDSIAAVIGRHYGKTKHIFNDDKSIEGTIAGAIAGAIAASFFVNWLYALIASTIAMIVEAIDWRWYQDKFDDNFFIPLIGSLVIFILQSIF